MLRTKLERNLLIGLWLGMGTLSAILFSVWQSPAWLGVAFPFGSIAGLVIYLVYYAFFSPVPEEQTDPFAPNRLLLAGLLAAVLAHYVEVHFGIAIAATRLHFFAYVGLILVGLFLIWMGVVVVILMFLIMIIQINYLLF